MPPQRVDRGADRRRLRRRAQVAVVRALAVDPVARASCSMPHVPRQEGDRQRAGERAGDHPAAARRAARRQHQPAAHGEPVEEREQHRRACARSGRSAAARRAGRHEHERSSPRRRRAAAMRRAARERQANDEPDRDRRSRAARAARSRVLRRPVGRRSSGSRRRSTVSARSAVPCSECSASPVTPGPTSAHSTGASDGQPGVAAARSRVARAAPQLERCRARRAPTPPAASARRARAAAAPARRAAAAAPRAAPRHTISDREGGVLVAEQRVALERRAASARRAR